MDNQQMDRESIEPMEIDAPSQPQEERSSTRRGPVGEAAKRTRDMYKFTPLLASSGAIRQGTVAKLPAAGQRAFRRRVMLNFLSLQLISVLTHALILGTPLKHDLAKLGEVIEHLGSIPLSDLLILFVFLVLATIILGATMWVSVAKASWKSMRVPMLVAFSLLLPWPCAVADILFDTNAVVLAQGAMMLGALVMMGVGSLPLRDEVPSASHWVGVLCAIGCAVIFTSALEVPLGLSDGALAATLVALTLLLLWLGFDLYKMRGLPPEHHLQACIFLWTDLLMVTCMPLIITCMCLLDGADMDGACYDLDEEIKKEVKTDKPLDEEAGGSSDPTWSDEVEYSAGGGTAEEDGVGRRGDAAGEALDEHRRAQLRV